MRVSEKPHRIVVVGGGFGGLQAVRALAKAAVSVTLIDCRNFHLFQPLLYQVATGALSPAEIAAPLRGVLKRQENAQVIMGEVRGFDLTQRNVIFNAVPDAEGEIDGSEMRIPYDSLIVAGGSRYSYFGHDAWRQFAGEIKSLESALEVRRRIFTAFEAAELEADPAKRQALLTFVVVGGGPTGVEMAGQIAELARDTLRSEFHAIDPSAARILLVEGASHVLSTFPKRLSVNAEKALRQLGVSPILNTTVIDLNGESVSTRDANGHTGTIPARTVIWAAGVIASPLATTLATASGSELDRGGRLPVRHDLTVKNHPEIIAIGDMVTVYDQDGKSLALPGLAPVAMQQGRYAARLIRARLNSQPTKPFHYIDKGDLATIGRAHAVGNFKGLHITGPLAWLIWLVIHIFYLIGFQNRLVVVLRWAFSFITRGRSARLITGDPTATR